MSNFEYFEMMQTVFEVVSGGAQWCEDKKTPNFESMILTQNKGGYRDRQRKTACRSFAFNKIGGIDFE